MAKSQDIGKHFLWLGTESAALLLKRKALFRTMYKWPFKVFGAKGKAPNSFLYSSFTLRLMVKQTFTLPSAFRKVRFLARYCLASKRRAALGRGIRS